jgi:ankyrin repeat protein
MGLHIAAQHGRYQMCEVLLGQGAEINATDKVSLSHKSGSELTGTVNLLWFCEKLSGGDSPISCVNWVECIGV